jgi:NAD(P)-dependent dehydrogenase (short-subunit alcohol dehydrogenase family)
MSTLKNKLAVVTGGNSGIGFSTAQELIAQGAKVIITGRDKTRIAEAAEQIGAIGIVADQASLTDTDALVKQIEAEHSKIDFLFINAGIGRMAPFEQITEEIFDEVMNINYKGAFFTLQKFVPLLNVGSSVVFLSSVNAQTAMATTSVYGPSKAALNALMKVVAYELAPKGIRVNSVSPGLIQTPIFGKTGLSGEQIDGLTAAFANRNPLKRIGTSEEVAKLVAFLASDDSTYITGSDYLIDGGVNLNPIFV